MWTRFQSQSTPLIKSAPILFLCMMAAPLGILLGLMVTYESTIEKTTD